MDFRLLSPRLPANVKDVPARRFQPDGVRIDEQVFQVGAEFQGGGEAGLGEIARVQRSWAGRKARPA